MRPNQDEEVPSAVIIRAGLAMYFREHPLPDGYFKKYIESIEDEEEEKALELLENRPATTSTNPETLFFPAFHRTKQTARRGD